MYTCLCCVCALTYIIFLFQISTGVLLWRGGIVANGLEGMVFWQWLFCAFIAGNYFVLNFCGLLFYEMLFYFFVFSSISIFPAVGLGLCFLLIFLSCFIWRADRTTLFCLVCNGSPF